LLEEIGLIPRVVILSAEAAIREVRLAPLRLVSDGPQLVPQFATLKRGIVKDDIIPAVIGQLVEVSRVDLPVLKLLIQLLQK